MTSGAAHRYHHGDLRAALLAQAGVTLERTGVAGLSLRELARDVGVSHGAPRRHFADKDALLVALAEDGFSRLGAELAAAAASAGGFAERLRATSHAYVDFATAHSALLDLMFAAKHGPATTPALVQASTATFAPLLQLLVEGQRAGAVVSGDVERVGTTVFAAVHGVASLAGAGMLDPSSVTTVVDDAVDRLLLGLQPR